MSTTPYGYSCLPFTDAEVELSAKDKGISLAEALEGSTTAIFRGLLREALTDALVATNAGKIVDVSSLRFSKFLVEPDSEVADGTICWNYRFNAEDPK